MATSVQRRARHPVTRVLVYAVLILGTLVTLVPFVWIVATSFKSSAEIVRIPPTFFPENWTAESYRTIFNDPRFFCRASISTTRWWPLGG